MALEQNSMLGHGGTGFQGTGAGSAAAMIKELQGLTVKVLTGAASATNIAVSGIATTDTILSCIEYESGVPVDRTSVTTISSAGNIQIVNDTTGNKVVLMYFHKA